MDTSIQLQKEKIREEMKARRAELCSTPERKRKFDAEIISKLLEMPPVQDAEVILVYESYKDEVDTHELIGIFHDLGKTVVVPRIESMDQAKMNLQVKSFDKNSIRSYVEPSAIECVITPGLAFDAKLNRIGFGKGFFDRLFHEVTCPKIGLAYDFQIVQNVPVDKHDEKLSYIITPTTIYE
ncbi:MAG: 5-formyltetrahydrofolate cyclo-ligase [Candidatus Peregrinibacteria bacterium]|nr:5-formyltetrahydrofolate cyclo-ligase [Candidatus Peregrinibacteria bacterium]MDZ4244800.1 5-formyltetrahydrofolate cyclo-ligase [Candidatus Gracilibacteria bacterium]